MDNRQLRVPMSFLREKGEKHIDPSVWEKEENRRGLKIKPLKVKPKQPGEIVHNRQYPISNEGRKGQQPIIESY